MSHIHPSLAAQSPLRLCTLMALLAVFVLDLPAKAQEDCAYVSTDLLPWLDAPGTFYSRDGETARVALYETGNLMPCSRFQEGAALAAELGSSFGDIGLVSIGMSNTHQEFQVLQDLYGSNPLKNANVVLLNGAMGGADAKRWADADPTASKQPWQGLKTSLQEELGEENVKVLWLKFALASPHNYADPNDLDSIPGSLSGHTKAYEHYVAITLRRMITDGPVHGIDEGIYLPNLQMVLLSNRTHACVEFGTGGNELNSEPYAYESAFAIQSMIAAQSKGADYQDLPFMAWGPYLWANGSDPRAYDGFQWRCPLDVVTTLNPNSGNPDCTHPSLDSGRAKVANLLWDFFTENPLAAPWFLNEPGPVTEPACVRTKFRDSFESGDTSRWNDE